MTRRRNVWLFVLCLVVLLTALGGYGLYRWEQFKQAQGILALELNGLRFAGVMLAADEFHVRRRNAEGGELDIRATDLALTLASLTRLAAPQSLHVSSLAIELTPAASSQSDPQDFPLPTVDDVQRVLAWLPREIRIESLRLTAPCVTGICREQGSFTLQKVGNDQHPEQFTSQLELLLEHQSHRLGLSATVRRNSDGMHLDLQLKADTQPRLTLQSSLQTGKQTDRLSGSLALNGLPEAPWLLEWLANWVAHEVPALPELPEQVRLGASWALQLPTGWLERSDWNASEGELRLSADVPTPWPLFDRGQVQGRLDLAASVRAGIWTPSSLAADLDLQPAADLLAQLPAAIRAKRIRLLIEPGTTGADSALLPLQVRASSEGPIRLALDAQLQVSTQPPLAVHIPQARLQLKSERLELEDWRLRTLTADLQLSGEAGQQAVRLAVGPSSRLHLASLTDGAAFSVERLQADLNGSQFAASFAPEQPPEVQLSGPLALKAARLTHPAVRPQGWRWNGKLSAQAGSQALDGTLENDAGLRLQTRIKRDAAGALRIAATLPEVFVRAGNPLAATLADWPALLELTTGRLQAQGTLDLPPAGTPTVNATATARSLGGIFDRTELSDLDASLALRLQRNRLRLGIEELRLEQANVGLEFGPLQFRGDYQADIGRLAEGRLGWQSAETQILGGRFWLDPGSLELNGSEQPLIAHLRGLQLPRLLEAYPSEGLSGTGAIDGDFEIRHGPQGLSVEQGTLAARTPGGALQFRSPQIQALGRSNPAMRLVTEALDDFHYDLLASDVRYTSDGTLLLGLRLHGRNPALEGGRPINFSINLEEDIPALLTSLQLSNRVSETIQRRVQERLR